MGRGQNLDNGVFRMGLIITVVGSTFCGHCHACEACERPVMLHTLVASHGISSEESDSDWTATPVVNYNRTEGVGWRVWLG